MIRRIGISLLLLAPCAIALGQDPAKDQTNSLGVMMSAAMEASKPLPEHDRLRRLAGEWTYVIEMTMPGTQAMHGSGKTSIREILGGRFIELQSKTDGSDGFENMMLMGYDSRKGSEDYFLLGVDSLGHYYIDLRGTWNEKTAALTLHGEEFDPNANRKIPYRQVFRFPGSDTMTCDIFMDMPGVNEDIRMVGVVYQRVSGATTGADSKSKSLDSKGVGSIRGGTAGTPPTRFTGEQLEAMDRSELQSALVQIMRARTMTEIESASRSNLDDQYTAALGRLRSMSASKPVASSTSGSMETATAANLPSFTNEMINGMSISEARAALTQIVTARRIPGLSSGQRDELSTAFKMILDHLSKTAGAGFAKQELESVEKEDSREKAGD